MLKELTSIQGLSGDESRVRAYIKEKISADADEIKVDPLGNLIAYKKGRSSQYRVMISAHMDEVGFIVTGYGESGVLKFKTIGGIDERILPGKHVWIESKGIRGVIGCKPMHLQAKEERANVIKLKNLYIDIGAEKKEEAERLAPLGEYISFYSEYRELGDCIKAKALDDRAGCAVLMEMLKDQYAFDLYACFTVQEEVGLRGSEVAAYQVNPDLALVVEATICSDVPGVSEKDYATRMGKGPALTLCDRTAFIDRKLLTWIYDVAIQHHIPIQYKQTSMGGNDAGKIQRTRSGVKVASISIPCRYIHSPASMMSKTDFHHCIDLVRQVLIELGRQDALKKLMDGGRLHV